MDARHETAETELRQHITSLAGALHAKDLEAIRRIYSPDVVSFDVEPPLQHVGIEAKLRNWERAFALFVELTYEVRDLAITAGDDVAFAHAFGRLSGTLNSGVSTPGMWVRATFCFSRIDGDWLIAHDQVSVPFDMATGRGVVDLQP